MSIYSVLDDEIELTERVIADHYGCEAQGNQLIEECAELIQSMNKYKRAKTKQEKKVALDSLKEEIADVEIMIDQMRYLLGISEDDIKGIKSFKLRRTVSRFKGAD